ncbi:MAG: putative pterin-4-alpha-carbinolamine dehydratase [Patescibacteria group bacterium]|nr:MAG: putative pterin-4-alpha-carbinolamine dehydratase [Patescibacteria group bacterium]
MLKDQKCIPCESGIAPLKRVEFEQYLAQVSGWTVIEDRLLQREFVFKNFKGAMIFVNKVAELAEVEGHHPDINIHGWNKVGIRLSTHAIGGLSINDFVMAIKVDALFG